MHYGDIKGQLYTRKQLHAVGWRSQDKQHTQSKITVT